jgi:purine-binding chemotaxis protein CheW
MAFPVVDAGRFVANASLPSTRFVVVRAGERRVALAVEAVIGVRRIPAGSLEGLPPLLASGNSNVDAVGTLDAKLFLVLGSARLVPEATWRALEADVVAP